MQSMALSWKHGTNCMALHGLLTCDTKKTQCVLRYTRVWGHVHSGHFLCDSLAILSNPQYLLDLFLFFIDSRDSRIDEVLIDRCWQFRSQQSVRTSSVDGNLVVQTWHTPGDVLTCTSFREGCSLTELQHVPTCSNCTGWIAPFWHWG